MILKRRINGRKIAPETNPGIGEEADLLYRNKQKGVKLVFISGDNEKVVLRKKEVLQILERHGGLVTHAARELKCPYKALLRYINGNKALKDTLDVMRIANVERAERKLRDLVESGSLGAICFTLKCQGRERGWVERVDVDIPVLPLVFKYSKVEPKASKSEGKK